jgi:[protein-PII] uridylyltransferase
LLADPDAFATVLDNVVQVQLADHRTTSESTTRAELARLLQATAVPGRVARRLVAQAPPLWLISEPAAVLAGDLALCHPRLGRREVRAVARPVEGSTLCRLTVVAADRPGLLADTAAVLATEGLSVLSASAATFQAGRLAMHSLTFDGGEHGQAALWEAVGDRLRDVGRGDVAAPGFVPSGRADVVVRRPMGAPADRAEAEPHLVEVHAPDQNGLLWAVTRWLADNACSIEAASATTDAGWARAVFVVSGTCDADDLADHLSRP